MPALIAHLNDARQTKIEITWALGGNMGLASYYDPKANRTQPVSPFTEGLPYDLNKMNARDSKVIKQVTITRKGESWIDKEYTACVGDICYMAIGQIVNRDLDAFAGVPTGTLDIDSPVYVPELADAVKKDWAIGNSNEVLKSSLIADITVKHSVRKYDALTRLCYYYPDIGIPLTLKLLNRAPHGATDVSDEGSIINSVMSCPSLSIDKKADQILRSLPPTEPLDYSTDDCAIACLNRLYNSKFRQDCENFYARRMPVLLANRTGSNYSRYYIQRYNFALDVTTSSN